jgi:O-acetyl-ADP-ribose deacetylase (regulator of RNase III)
MKTKKGDLLQLAADGHFDVIVHGCNCFCRMGAGIARSIKSEFPEAFKADQATREGDEKKLGSFSSATVERNGHTIVIVNGYTQYNSFGEGVLVDYEAVRNLFALLKKEYGGKRIGYPKIGAGLAGGDWKEISTIIDREMEGEDHTLVIFGP